MSVTVTTTRVTMKYLMGKTKHDLACEFLMLMDMLEKERQAGLPKSLPCLNCATQRPVYALEIVECPGCQAPETSRLLADSSES